MDDIEERSIQKKEKFEFKETHNRFEPDLTTSSYSNSIMSMNCTKLDELKRQQAKLDKIQAEKSKLEAYLNYQQEMSTVKQQKEQ